MLRYLQLYRFQIALALFLLLPILSIDTATRSPREHHWGDRVVVTLTSPIQAIIAWGLDSVVSGFNRYVYLRDLREENHELVDENRRLLNTVVQLREAQDENQRLRDILKFKESYTIQGVVARVIAKDVSTEFRSIRLNRGSNHGIHKDMAVTHPEGIVGRVIRVTHDTADVVTVLDLLSAIDALVKRSRARGIVVGMTDDLCQLKFALRTDDILPGDVLLSSGLGGIFPKGIPVGTVSKVLKRHYGITQDVEVRPSVDFSKLEEVFVITHFDPAPLHVTEQEQSFVRHAGATQTSVPQTRPAP